jgi:hypothetical protein
MSDARLNAAALPKHLQRFWVAIILITVVAALYTTVHARLYHLPAPYGLPLLWDDSRQGDFLVFQPGFRHFRTPQFWDSFRYPFTYPAPLAVVFGVLYQTSHPVRVYLLLLTAALGLGAWAFVRDLRSRGIAPATAWAFTLTCLALNWPVLFEFDTANMEGLVAITLALGVLCLVKERWWIACVLIGIAGAMKLFPFILLGAALSQRRYKEVAGGLLIAGVVMVGSLAILGPSIPEAQRHIDVGLRLIQHEYLFTLKPDGPALDHSLWVPLRYGTVWVARRLQPLSAAAEPARTAALLDLSLRIYIACAALFGAVLYALRIRKLPMLNQLIALTICAVLLPPLSLEYTLLHLLVPFALFCAYATDMERARQPSAGLGLCFACFATLFTLETFLAHGYFFAAQVHTIALVVLLISVLRWRFAFTGLRGAGA